MKRLPRNNKTVSVIFGLWLFVCMQRAAFGQTAGKSATTNEIHVVEIVGIVEISRSATGTWTVAQTNQILHPSDRLRTGVNSRVALGWSDQSVVSFDASTELEILPPSSPQSEPGLHLFRGLLSFFHRGEPGRIRVTTRGTVAGIEGTEFVLGVESVGDNEQTTLSVIEGRVQFGNDQGTLSITNNQQAIAVSGEPPRLTTGFVANNILQWCFYYPAIIDPDDLVLDEEENSALQDSLLAYRSGDLLDALAKFPAQPPASDSVHVYHAALLLSVGQVEQTEAELAHLHSAKDSDRVLRLAAALGELISAVQHRKNSSVFSPALASEFMAASYYEQSLAKRGASLERARRYADEATKLSPEFGYSWVRLAELEFSFGKSSASLEALNKGLLIAPRNAQGIALKGFIRAAENRVNEAILFFDQALSIDPSLANAWLGRGLCRIKVGKSRAGREDLLVAAALEPRRAELRDYLGKAFEQTGDYERAAKELQLAKNIDPLDPTSWFYSALMNQQRNHINEAIHDLETSKMLNDNRGVYRSALLLDQDQAVRSASLASIYKDAGMYDISLQEASKAVNYDYANYSAHLFLANSYDALRDPNGINLRYETPAESEYLIANILAPVGAGTLSQTISQQEYSKLFERDRFGAVSSTEYLSRGAWHESGAQFGTFGNTSYAFEAFSYRTDPGQWVDNDNETRDFRFHLKQQIGPADTVYFRAVYQDNTGGDENEYYNLSDADTGLRTKDTQEPTLNVGYHHEWNPGIHTLFLASRLHSDYSVFDPYQPTFFATTFPPYPPLDAEKFFVTENYRSVAEIYSTELQQIWEQADHNTVVGARYQFGNFHTHSLQTNPNFLSNYPESFFDPATSVADQDVRSTFERLSFYGYHSWQILPALQLDAGLAYDSIKYPDDYRAAPINDQEDTKKQLSPKAGFIWSPVHNFTVRFGYTRSLAGAGIDQDYLLEPSQFAGFNQSFRSIIPESVGGAEAGAKFETFGLAIEQKMGSGTYLNFTGQILDSHVQRTLGDFEFNLLSSTTVQPSGTPNPLAFTERDITLGLNQLLGKEWALGANYKLTQADLKASFPEFPDAYIPDLGSSPTIVGFSPSQSLSAALHQITLQIIYNHPSGFFSQIKTAWYQQDNQGYSPALPTSAFWQSDFIVGYRLPGRRAQLQVGLLNITGQDYQLNPLTLYNELPHGRNLSASLQLAF